MSGGRFQGVPCCLLRVRSYPILCVSVRSCVSPLARPACRLVRRPVSRPVCLVVGAVRRAVACLPVSLRLWGGRCCPISSRSLFSSARYGERGGVVSASRLACLADGAGVNVRRPVPVQVSVRLLAPCRSVDVGGDWMR